MLAEGLENAAVCTSQLLPEISATILNINYSPGSDISKPPQLPDDYFSGLESFVGHKFRDSRLLKEALTHPSCQNDADTLSYQRLEFVRDAALDMLTEQAPSLPPAASYQSCHGECRFPGLPVSKGSRTTRCGRRTFKS